MKKKGKKRYKQEMRNAVESFFASFKGRYGEHVMSRKLESERLKVLLKIWLYNRSSVMRGGR